MGGYHGDLRMREKIFFRVTKHDETASSSFGGARDNFSCAREKMYVFLGHQPSSDFKLMAFPQISPLQSHWILQQLDICNFNIDIDTSSICRHGQVNTYCADIGSLNSIVFFNHYGNSFLLQSILSY